MDAWQEVAKRVELAERERDEVKWYLGEERTKRESLETALAQLQASLDAATGQGQELQNTIKRLTAELNALRTHWGERRRRTRVRLPGVVVEVDNGSNDSVFAGSPRDVSSVGIGLETERQIPSESSIRVRVSLPSFTEPIESVGQLIWQRAEVRSGRYQSGYQLVDLSAASRDRLEQLVEDAQRPPPG